MLNNLNIISKLHSLKKDITDVNDLKIINDLIEKYNVDNIKNLKDCSDKDFSSNARFINRYIKDEIYFKLPYYKADNITDEFFKSKTYKDLVLYRFYINKNAKSDVKNIYRETLNLYSIETINKYFNYDTSKHKITTRICIQSNGKIRQ